MPVLSWPFVRPAPVVTSSAGMVLVEIYDIDATSELVPRLANLSTCGVVEPGGDLTAGFVVRGNTPKRVLIRGVGPALAGFGIGAALADPTLKVFAQGAAAPLAANDNWDASLASDAAAAGAFPLAAGSKDAALVLTLEPGDYSAVVSGALGGNGTALVEVYQLPD